MQAVPLNELEVLTWLLEQTVGLIGREQADLAQVEQPPADHVGNPAGRADDDVVGSSLPGLGH
jgi:hypothetical protein